MRMSMACSGLKGAMAAASVIIVVCVSSAWAGETSKTFPILRYEAEQVIVSWLEMKGYDVVTSSNPDQVSIRAKGKSYPWNVALKHKSTLATRIEVNDAPAGGAAELWQYLAAYLNGDAKTYGRAPEGGSGPGTRIPTPVAARMDLVVCIRASVGGSPVQLTGFVVDTSGLILCTAHTLVKPDSITVILSDGQALQGKLVKADYKRDLALIDCSHSFGRAVRLSSSKHGPGKGVKVYSAGCPLNLGGTLVSGVMNGTPRLVEGQLLLQVQMEVEPGSSGSPVFDSGGNLAGVVKGRIKGNSFAGLLIPVETVISFVKER